MPANQPATHAAAAILAHRTLERLARVLGGRLQLASMPPVQGRMAPFGRVVRHCHDVASTDVLLPGAAGDQPCRTEWMIPPDAATDRPYRWPDDPRSGDRVYRWWEAHQAFERGAAAVVAQGDGLEPWAGRSIIVVDDLETAVRRWQQCCLAVQGIQQTREQRRLRRGGRNCGISTLPSLLG
jgi:hypothetical protein